MDDVTKTRKHFFPVKTIWFTGIIAFLSLLPACFKKENYSPIPNIYDASVNLLEGDSARLTFGFTDGDGDIGLADSEIDAPYDTSSRYHYNLYIEYFEKDDALGWVPGINLGGDTIVFKYRLHPVVVKGKNKGIKGTMDVIMQAFYNPLSTQSDTIKYRIQLIDHALNESNLIETDEIVH